MAGYIGGVDREQATLFPQHLDDWVDEDHLVRVVDLFVDELNIKRMATLIGVHALLTAIPD